MSEVDRLEVKVEAQARNANRQLDTLVTKLNGVRSALTGVNGNGLSQMSAGVLKLSRAMQGMNAVKTSDFTRLSKNIQKLGNIDSASLARSAQAMHQMTSAFNGLGGVSANAVKIGELAKNISKLGNKSAQSAIANMPKMADALNKMMQQLSKAPAVSNKVIKLTDSLARLSANGSKVGSASRGLNNALNNYSRNASNASTKTTSLASKIGLLYAKFWVLQRIVKGFGSTVKSSMDYVEQYNFYNVALDKIASEWSKDYEKYGYENADSYGKSFSGRLEETLGKMTGFQMNQDGTLTDLNNKNLGLDVTGLTNYTANIAQLTNSLGMCGEASVVTSKALAMVATDQASYMNLSNSEAMENFSSGIIGQSRALYKYGIDITNATLQQYAYDNGVTKSVKSMTQAEKMQLRLLAILDQSKVAYADLANTINSPSNQLKMLQNNFAALARTIGNIFLPIVAKVIPYLNGLVIAVRRAVEWIGNLLGVDLSSITSSSSSGYSDTFADLADDADDATSATTGTDKAVKKLKRDLMGFDEINKLSDNSDSSGSSGSNGSGGGDAIDLTGAMSDALAAYEKVWNKSFDRMNNKANEFANKLAAALKPAKNALQHLYNDGFKKLANFTSGTLKDFYKDFLKPMSNYTIGVGFPKLVNMTNDFCNKVDWKGLKSSLKGFYGVLANLGTIGFTAIETFYKDVLLKLSKWALNSALPTLLNIFTDLSSKINWNVLNSAVKNFIKAIGSIAQGIGQGLINFAKGFYSATKGLVAATLNALAGALNAIGKAIQSMPQGVYDTLVGGLIGLFGALKAFNAIKSVPAIISTVKVALSGLIAAVSANPILLIASAVGALVGALVAWSGSGKKIAVQEEGITKANTDIKELKTNLTEAKQAIKDFNTNQSDVEAEYGAIDNLANSYYNLSQKANKSNKEKALMKTYSQELIEKIPELKGTIDKETGAYKGTKNELQKLIKKTKDYYMLQAAQDDLVEIGKKMYKAQKSISKAQADVNKNTKTYNALVAKKKEVESDVLGYSANKYDELQEKISSYKTNISNSNKELSKARTTYSSLNTQYSQATTYISDLSSEYEGLSGKASSAKSNVDGVNASLGNTPASKSVNFTANTSDVDTASHEASKGIDKNVNIKANTTESYKKAVGNAGKGITAKVTLKPATAMSTLAKQWAEQFQKNWKPTWNLNIKGKDGTVTQTTNSAYWVPAKKDGGMFKNGKWNNIAKYAQGGLPNSGQLFAAREAGPELVGKIGNSTAVVNNDQIVASVADGVYKAVVGAMSVVGQKNNNIALDATLIVGGKEITDVVIKEVKQRTKASGFNPIA